MPVRPLALGWLFTASEPESPAWDASGFRHDGMRALVQRSLDDTSPGHGLAFWTYNSGVLPIPETLDDGLAARPLNGFPSWI